jgi:hypothetical protein
MGNSFLNQISNRNFLSPLGFKFNLSKYPKVDFFSNQVNIPGFNLGVAVQSSYLKDIPVPGDKLSYDDLTLRFIIDEDMENYLIVHDWMRGFGYPENVYEYQNLLNEEQWTSGRNLSSAGQSDGTIIVYNSSMNPTIKATFKGLFPVSLSPISFDSTSNDVNYVSAEVTFKYTIFAIGKYEY